MNSKRSLLTTIGVALAIGCSPFWSVLDVSTSPSGKSRLKLLTRAQGLELRLRVLVEDSGETIDVLSSDKGWYITGTHVAWSDDSSEVVAIVCQNDDPTFVGFDFEAREPVLEREGFLLATRLAGVVSRSNSYTGANPFSNACEGSRCLQPPCRGLSQVTGEPGQEAMN